MTKKSKDEVNMQYGVRSGLEGKTLEQLVSAGIKHSYEPHKISFVQPAKKRSYTPDFLITTLTGKEMYIETKGRFMIADRQKHEWVSAQYPDIDIRFVFTNPKAKISPASKTTYAEWCESRGYLWAKGEIPVGWLEE